jgi:hypothetical protein
MAVKIGDMSTQINLGTGWNSMTVTEAKDNGNVRLIAKSKFNTVMIILDEQNIRTLIEHLQKQITPCTTQ